MFHSVFSWHFFFHSVLPQHIFFTQSFLDGLDTCSHCFSPKVFVQSIVNILPASILLKSVLDHYQPDRNVLTHSHKGIFFFFFFFFFFDLGFTALSRIFHLYRADCSSKVGENRRTQRKTTWPSVSRTWLSHIWPEPGSNHSGEKPNGSRVNSLIH